MPLISSLERIKRKPSESDPFRVLVPDPYCVYGGIESVNCNLLPRLTESEDWDFTWMIPEHRELELKARIGDSKLRFVTVEWENFHPNRWVDAAARRFEQRFNGMMRRQIQSARSNEHLSAKDRSPITKIQSRMCCCIFRLCG